MGRVVSWFSCGAASAVATKIALNISPETIPVYCATGSEHSGNVDFMNACANWFGKEIEIIKSEKYDDTWQVWEQRRFLSGIKGAPCTGELKVVPRLNHYSLPSDVHVFGYTADKADIKRVNNLKSTYPNMNIKAPLIEKGLTKSNVLRMIEDANIELPIMYKMGFHNNNCIPCVKATSPSYWALIRKEFPKEFERMVKLSRKLNVRLARLKGQRIFIDEIPLNHKTTNPIQPACDFLCSFAEIEKETQ